MRCREGSESEKVGGTSSSEIQLLYSTRLITYLTTNRTDFELATAYGHI